MGPRAADERGWFRRLMGRFGADRRAAKLRAQQDEAEAQQATMREERAPTKAMELTAAMSARRFDEAMRVLRAAREGPDEGAVLEALLSALGPPKAHDDEALEGAANDAVSGDAHLPDEHLDALLLALSEVLVARGDRRRACEVLSRARSTSAMVLRADLLCEGVDGLARPAELDLALSLLSKALVADIDAPGARDRWERLRARLGHGAQTTGPSIGATLIAKGGALPFTLVGEVARGGAGVVYEARETLTPSLTRTIALKMIHAPVTSRAQLLHEARVAARFRGVGVVQILDVDVDGGWLTMTWAPGQSLRARLQRQGDANASSTRQWLCSLLATLADVHDAGWIHGDVKPANVLFDAGARPMLGDFGLARAIGQPQTAGSAGYVSPERAAGEPASAGDDVYGVGRLLEDVIAAGWAGDEAESLRMVSAQCLAPKGRRLPDARAVLRELSR